MLLLVAASAVEAQTVPTGWNVVTDVRKACQIAVPGDWEGDGSTRSPKGNQRVTVTVHGLRATETFDGGKATARQVSPPKTILQDDAKRLLYTMDAPRMAGVGTSGWYVVLNTKPVCTASFTFDPGADEALFRKIADTLGPVAK
jgi:hypothetical protein